MHVEGGGDLKFFIYIHIYIYIYAQKSSFWKHYKKENKQEVSTSPVVTGELHVLTHIKWLTPYSTALLKKLIGT